MKTFKEADETSGRKYNMGQKTDWLLCSRGSLKTSLYALCSICFLLWEPIKSERYCDRKPDLLTAHLIDGKIICEKKETTSGGKCWKC